MLQSFSGHLPHFILESLAYMVGAQVYWYLSKQAVHPPKIDRFLLLAFAVFGAFLGSKLLHIFEHLPYLLSQPTGVWFGGKSVLGGFLGGTLFVEIGKKIIKWPYSTGDVWIVPLAVGLMIGRLGCQLSGLWDSTYGISTSLPWGWDYGDGIARHPTALYEMILVFVLTLGVCQLKSAVSGRRFDCWMIGYCMIRLGIEFLKPPFGQETEVLLPVALHFGLTAIQWASVLGIAYFIWHIYLQRKNKIK
ncbi:prolipoprotein diacylglyceryl transferase [Neisseria sp. Ec49-e6-T10]|uniref:prolipoprotein diacylglyceryl transferase n=1 Tax=Neisseria sp. Ec49-e6-T10 TaxID=3140744 RepID=UPI003EBDECBC